MDRIFTVLFVCTGNTCRSAMAEAICRAEAGQRRLVLRATSAGTSPGDPVPQEAREAVRCYGADVAGHTPRKLTEAMLVEADLVLAMTGKHLTAIPAAYRGKAHRLRDYGAPARPGDIADPWGGSQKVYEECAAEIREAILGSLDRLEEEGRVARVV